MKLWRGVLPLWLLSSPSILAAAAQTWGFADATVSVQTKGAGVGAGLKEKIPDNKSLSKVIEFGATDTLKITLTTQEGRTAKRPHQVFLLLKEPKTGLDVSYPFTVKENGKARIELSREDLPVQFVGSSQPIDASFLIGSFGDSKAYNGVAFELAVPMSPDETVPVKTERYGKLPEIHHIFKSDAKNPPIVITLAFVAMVLAAFPALCSLWLYLGVNLNHLSTAFKAGPLPHAVFLASLISLEGIFFLYYTSWNLFQTLPVALAVGSIAFISGSRALGEVQGRRLAGLR